MLKLFLLCCSAVLAFTAHTTRASSTELVGSEINLIGIVCNTSDQIEYLVGLMYTGDGIGIEKALEATNAKYPVENDRVCAPQDYPVIAQLEKTDVKTIGNHLFALYTLKVIAVINGRGNRITFENPTTVYSYKLLSGQEKI